MKRPNFSEVFKADFSKLPVKTKAIFIRTGLTTETVLSVLNKYSTHPAECTHELRDCLTIVVNANIDWAVVCAKEKITYLGGSE